MNTMDKIEINVAHYGPNHNLDSTEVNQSRIWVNVYYIEDGESELIGTDYINNPFPKDYFGTDSKNFQRQAFSGVMLKTVVMEHSNGGRSNENVYNSVTEYLADPVVKELCRAHINGGLAYALSSNGGDPDKVDYVVTCKFDDFPEEFTVENRSYDSIIPQAWLNEFCSDTIVGLSKCGVWPDAESAIKNTERNDDLFGERLFPVLKAPKELASLMRDICYGFKSYSDPLEDDEFVYIGIRSKIYEICTINEIYAAGGWILQYQQWDW